MTVMMIMDVILFQKHNSTMKCTIVTLYYFDSESSIILLICHMDEHYRMFPICVLSKYINTYSYIITVVVVA